ncbi:MAG: hypothetical protein KC468_29215 [Myxococcales bacterium]|nr:hypothetical protein [Myxococcales bacterium]
MRRATYLALTPLLLLLQAALVNGCLLLIARWYSVIPLRALAGLVFLFVIPIAGAVAVMLAGTWLIRQFDPRAAELEHRLLIGAGITGATLWLAAAAGLSVGLHDYGMLRVHGARAGVRPTELPQHREAGFASLAGAEVRWQDVGTYHWTSRPKDSTTTYHHYALAYPIRDVVLPNATPRAWLCVKASSPRSLPEFSARYQQDVEAAGVVAGLPVRDLGEVSRCQRAAAEAASRGVVKVDAEPDVNARVNAPVFLRFRPSVEEVRATLERRVVILLLIVNGLFVLLPFALDLRRGLTDPSLT